uniref:AlNc14C78G5161 protein n=1 Tax=Albugo laibachii Nc14 TaxID=890382 RepID=F0WEW3_9STRA|nr:AlNc14C78G5161 [Albugo laibachii Nc14]|eukprot:CCA19745.1 AlNc14C78G5161 [Albugo laibachii Nc14]
MSLRTVRVAYKKVKFTISFDALMKAESLVLLKKEIEKETGVSWMHQKLIYRGKVISNVSQLPLNNSMVMMMLNEKFYASKGEAKLGMTAKIADIEENEVMPAASKQMPDLEQESIALGQVLIQVTQGKRMHQFLLPVSDIVMEIKKRLSSICGHEYNWIRLIINGKRPGNEIVLSTLLEDPRGGCALICMMLFTEEFHVEAEKKEILCKLLEEAVNIQHNKADLMHKLSKNFFDSYERVFELTSLRDQKVVPLRENLRQMLESIERSHILTDRIPVIRKALEELELLESEISVQLDSVLK